MNPTSVLSGLGSAVSADPALGAPAGGTPGAGDLFLALVEGLLSHTGEQAGEAIPADPTADPDTAEAAAIPTEPAVDAEAAGTPTSTTVATSVLAALAGLVPQPTTPPSGGGTAAGGTTGPATREVADQPATAGATKCAVPTTAGTTPAPAAADSAATPLPTAERNPSTPAAPAAAGDSAADSSATTAATPALAAEASSAATLSTTSSTPAGTSPVAAVGAPAATTAVAPTTPVTAPTAADPHRVIDQVFSQIVQSSGSSQQGTQRLTVRLNPENLGEVRVVLTQRQGELQVTLAAGDQARASLLEGSHELRRLLESVGHTDSRIVVRDPAAPTQTTSVTASTGRSDLSGDTAGWAGEAGSAWSEAAPEQRERRSSHPGSTTATDGTPVSTNPSRRPDDAGRSHTGLDLSM